VTIVSGRLIRSGESSYQDSARLPLVDSLTSGLNKIPGHRRAYKVAGTMLTLPGPIGLDVRRLRRLPPTDLRVASQVIQKPAPCLSYLKLCRVGLSLICQLLWYRGSGLLRQTISVPIRLIPRSYGTFRRLLPYLSVSGKRCGGPRLW
jgi:hypothetical protein